MSPLPPPDALPYGGSIPPSPPKLPDWVNDREELLRRLVRMNEMYNQAIDANLDLRDELRECRLERVEATEKVVALTNIVNSLQGRIHAVAAQAQRANNTANEAWMGTLILGVLSVALPLVNPAYKGACWAAKGAKDLACSAKATLATYGITGIVSNPPLMLGAPI